MDMVAQYIGIANYPENSSLTGKFQARRLLRNFIAFLLFCKYAFLLNYYSLQFLG